MIESPEPEPDTAHSPGSEGADSIPVASAHTSCENVHSGSWIRLHLRPVRLLAHAAVALWRHPVKSMLREELNAADVAGRCLMGDRTHALDDQVTGTVARAKHPRKPGCCLTTVRSSSFLPVPIIRPATSAEIPAGWDWSFGR